MFFETPDSPRIAQSDFFDFFTRVHWVSVPVLFVPITAVGLALSVGYAAVAWYTTIALFAVGFVAWTLSEYWLHRTLFHWQPGGKLGEQFHFLVHGVHHKWPSDRYRLVMPPWVNLTLLVIVATPVLLITPTYGWGLLAGYVFGYMVYDVMHYWLHHGRFQSTYMKRLKAHHMNHHHNPKPRKYGVSFMVWDHVFGTFE
jgi:sterol desaturase/sphingolipid hydroxylase (fatty acid hydroxylase superfamily)